MNNDRNREFHAISLEDLAELVVETLMEEKTTELEEKWINTLKAAQTGDSEAAEEFCAFVQKAAVGELHAVMQSLCVLCRVVTTMPVPETSIDKMKIFEARLHLVDVIDAFNHAIIPKDEDTKEALEEAHEEVDRLRLEFTPTLDTDRD